MIGSRTTSPARLWPAAANATLLLVASTLAFAGLSLAPPQAPGAPVAVVFPPWWGATRSFLAASAAGVAVIRAGAIPAILVVRLDDAASRARLRSAGAVFFLDPQALGGCTGKISS